MDSNSVVNKLIDFEKNYPVETVKANGMPLWPFLRNYFFDQATFNKDRTVKLTDLNKMRLLKSVFYGISDWNRNYDFLFFSSSNQRKAINGVFYDRSVDYIASRTENALIIEQAAFAHFKKKIIPSKHIASKSLLFLLEEFYKKISLRSIKTENYGLLEKISAETGLEVDYLRLTKKFLAQFHIGKYLAKKYKPKCVFFVNSYNNMGYLAVFRYEGVQVVEIQHGIINKSHFAYNVYKAFPKEFYPDYLLTYGRNELQVFGNGNYFINPENVFPVGHYYLELIRDNFRINSDIENVVKKYQKSVCVSGQDAFDDEMVDFIIKTAQKAENVVFLYVPRSKPAKYYEQKYATAPGNLLFVDNINVYEAILSTDFHSTVNSTTSIEASALGRPTVFINLENRSKKYYSEMFAGKNFVRYAQSPDEMRDFINTLNFREEEVREEAADIIVPNYKQNIDNFLSKILKI